MIRGERHECSTCGKQEFVSEMDQLNNSKAGFLKVLRWEGNTPCPEFCSFACLIEWAEKRRGNAL